MRPSDAEVARQLRAILETPEFQPSFADRLSVWIGEGLGAALRWLAARPSSVRLAIVTVCLLALVAVAIQVWLALRPRVRRSAHTRRHPQPAGGVDHELHAQDLLGRARWLAEAGELRPAARTLLQLLWIELCRQRGVSWVPTRCDGEWERVLAAPPAVVALTRQLQDLAYGSSPRPPAFEAAVASLAQAFAEVACGPADPREPRA